jgi:hypothetical protein
VIIHDEVYPRTERDPWIFYDQGKKENIVITSDKAFAKSFPHMAAISLGKTTVLYFSKGHWRSGVRGQALLTAKSQIFHALKKQESHFLACIGLTGTFTIVTDRPRPSRKICDPQDWDSYKRVCDSEGVSIEGVTTSEKGAESDETEAKSA